MLFIVLSYIRDQTTTSNFSQRHSNLCAKMEHHAQSIDDALIGGLSFKLKPGASHTVVGQFHILLPVAILTALMALK